MPMNYLYLFTNQDVANNWQRGNKSWQHNLVVKCFCRQVINLKRRQKLFFVCVAQFFGIHYLKSVSHVSYTNSITIRVRNYDDLMIQLYQTLCKSENV